MPNRMEEAMSKGAGKVKAATARLKGLTGVFNHLAEEHTEASTLLKRAKSAHEPAKQQDIWLKLRKELLSHEKAEMSEVYSELERHNATRELVMRHNREAEQLERAIAQVDQADYGTEAWQARLSALEQLVKEHVHEEEHDFFPKAQDALDQETIRDLEQRFEQAKKAIMAKLD